MIETIRRRTLGGLPSLLLRGLPQVQSAGATSVRYVSVTECGAEDICLLLRGLRLAAGAGRVHWRKACLFHCGTAASHVRREALGGCQRRGVLSLVNACE